MRKRQNEKDAAYEAQWDSGRGSHHPDYDPLTFGEGVLKASRQTEELYNAIVKNEIKLVYQKLSEGATLVSNSFLDHAIALVAEIKAAPLVHFTPGYRALLCLGRRGRQLCFW